MDQADMKQLTRIPVFQWSNASLLFPHVVPKGIVELCQQSLSPRATNQWSTQPYAPQHAYSSRVSSSQVSQAGFDINGSQNDSKAEPTLFTRLLLWHKTNCFF